MESYKDLLDACDGEIKYPFTTVGWEEAHVKYAVELALKMKNEEIEKLKKPEDTCGHCLSNCGNDWCSK